MSKPKRRKTRQAETDRHDWTIHMRDYLSLVPQMIRAGGTHGDIFLTDPRQKASRIQERLAQRIGE